MARVNAPLLYDYEIRGALKVRVHHLHAADPTTIVLDELGLRRRRARADVAVVNGLLHGYEIKSERDSLRRLPTQAVLYGEVFDRASIVTAEAFTSRVLQIIPEWWEILVAIPSRGAVELEVLREGRLNSSPSSRTRAEFISKDHVLRLLEARGAARGIRGQPRRVLWDRLCLVLTADEVAAAARAAIKLRTAPPATAEPSV